jgi:hypothetical protein
LALIIKCLILKINNKVPVGNLLALFRARIDFVGLRSRVFFMWKWNRPYMTNKPNL